MNSWSIEKEDLRIIVIIDGKNFISGRLRNITSYGYFFTNKRINKGRFSGIWTTNDRNISDFFFRKICCSSEDIFEIEFLHKGMTKK